MNAGELILWLGLAAIGLVGSALASGMETGLYASSRARLTVRAQSARGRRARAALAHIARPDQSLATLLIANNSFNYLSVLSVTALLTQTSLSETGIVIVNTLAVTPIVLVLCESLPKEFFRRVAERGLERVVWVLTAFRIIALLSLSLPLVVGLARLVARATGMPREPELGARAQLADNLKESGAITDSQSELIDRLLSFRQASVRDEMTPWSRVASLAHDASREQALRLIERTTWTRFPVASATGAVVGFVSAIDILTSPATDLAAMLRDVPRLPPRTPASEALAVLQSAHAPLAIVEQSGIPIGLVTPKDLVERLTGELLAW
ncbi:MAG: DUF21 domain-containing protein [Phycisphaeraceae bacterium]|nr:DUF21 domain-containing protein [Phycisphaeraceae bacterium]